MKHVAAYLLAQLGGNSKPDDKVRCPPPDLQTSLPQWPGELAEAVAVWTEMSR